MWRKDNALPCPSEHCCSETVGPPSTVQDMKSDRAPYDSTSCDFIWNQNMQKLLQRFLEGEQKGAEHTDLQTIYLHSFHPNTSLPLLSFPTPPPKSVLYNKEVGQRLGKSHKRVCVSEMTTVRLELRSVCIQTHPHTGPHAETLSLDSTP